MRRILFKFVMLSAIMAVGFGTIYVSAQQVYRQTADDPQVEVAEEIANALNLGSDPSSISQQAIVELSRSLLPVVLVFDKDGNVTATNATLDSQPPTFPKGALEASNATGENRVTWEPRTGVRMATVIRPYKSEAAEGYVLVGRSLREVERRINRLTVHVGIAFAVAELLLAIFMVAPHAYRIKMRKKMASPEPVKPAAPVPASEVKPIASVPAVPEPPKEQETPKI